MGYPIKASVQACVPAPQGEIPLAPIPMLPLTRTMAHASAVPSLIESVEDTAIFVVVGIVSPG